MPFLALDVLRGYAVICARCDVVCCVLRSMRFAMLFLALDVMFCAVSCARCAVLFFALDVMCCAVRLCCFLRSM